MGLSLRPLRTGAFPNEYCYHHEPLLAATAGAGVIPGLMGYSNPVVLSTAASATTSSAAAGVLNPAAMMAASGGLPAALALNPALIPGLNLNLMAQDKINRELFVGNTPPGTSEALLREFLNGALKRVGLAAANHTKPL